MNDVFISYAHNDFAIASQICSCLDSLNISCWMDKLNILAGDDYADEIEKAIIDCKIFVVIFSKNAAISEYVKSETRIAFCKQKTIIPFRIDDTELAGALNVHLGDKHWIKKDVKILSANILANINQNIYSNNETLKGKNPNRWMTIILALILAITVIPFVYFTLLVNDSYPQICMQKKWGVISEKGEFIVDPKYDYIEPFKGREITIVKSNGNFGIVTIDGEEYISPSDNEYSNIWLRESRYIGLEVCCKLKETEDTVVLRYLEILDYVKNKRVQNINRLIYGNN